MKLGELKSAIRKVKGPVGVLLYIPGHGPVPFPLVKGAMIETIDAIYGAEGNRGTETPLSVCEDLLVMDGMEATAFVPDPDTPPEVLGATPDSGPPEEIGEPEIEDAEEIAAAPEPVDADDLDELLGDLDDLIG